MRKVNDGEKRLGGIIIIIKMEILAATLLPNVDQLQRRRACQYNTFLENRNLPASSQMVLYCPT